ncbi:hypothetical protein NKH77_34095 [Streptomyces sp. M19]
MVDRDGPECVCGRRGCLQATASGPATLAHAASLRGTPSPSTSCGPDWATACPGRSRPWTARPVRSRRPSRASRNSYTPNAPCSAAGSPRASRTSWTPSPPT